MPIAESREIAHSRNWLAGNGDHIHRGAALLQPMHIAHSADRHGNLSGEPGEIGEDAPNEANRGESVNIIEANGPIQVTADSRALWRLDKGVAQPGEGRTLEQGKVPGPASAGSNPRPPTPVVGRGSEDPRPTELRRSSSSHRRTCAGLSPHAICQFRPSRGQTAGRANPY